MSRTLRILLASSVVALGASLLTATAQADDWEDYAEAWEDYYKSLRRQNRHHQPGAYYQPRNDWQTGQPGYGAAAWHPRQRFYTSYDQPWHYGYGVQPWYGHAVPYYGSSYYGHGRHFWRPRSLLYRNW